MKKICLYCCCVLFLLAISPPSLYANDLSSILITDYSYREISKEDSELLMNIQQSQMLKAIREIYGQMDCAGLKNIPSQHAIAYIGLFGEQGDVSLIKNVWNCDNLHAKELLPCEYYCAYKFALDLHEVRFKKKAMPLLDKNHWPLFANKFTTSLQVDSISEILAKLTEDDLVRSLNDKKLRPALPTHIIEGMDDFQIEYFYRFSVYFQLAKVAKKKNTRDELFKELLYLYFRDASGDGGVSNLQQTILLIEERLK